jgi:hypothetical protein
MTSLFYYSLITVLNCVVLKADTCGITPDFRVIVVKKIWYLQKFSGI